LNSDGDTELVFFNYRFCTHKTFPPLDSAANAKERLLFQIKRECRGLVFRVEPGSKHAGKLEARMFHKFFNGAKKMRNKRRLIVGFLTIVCFASWRTR
jgi:hypothetical protein